MKEPKHYHVVSAFVDAMQVVEGVTTKRDILNFCPDADVAAKVLDPEGDPEAMDSTQLRWVSFTDCNDQGQEVGYGDWIVKGPAGFFLRNDESFPVNYREVAHSEYPPDNGALQ